MPLITDYSAVRDVYRQAAEAGASLAAFCAEDRETLEAMLAAAVEVGREIGAADLPVVPSWTSRYPPRGQMKLVTACGDALLGTQLMLSDLEAFAGPNSPYRELRILPHLDHAFPWLDGDVLDTFADRFASVMCDASEKPFEENIRLTASYVERVAGRVVVEGCVDEIYESGGGARKNEPTSSAEAREFVSRTGADLIVPNVGTEHRATAEHVRYLGDRAREIRDAVGPILCLHGTSSLKSEDLQRLAADGFVKVNIYTTLAVHGGQAVARRVIEDLPDILEKAEIERLTAEGVLGPAVLGEREGGRPIGPKLVKAANPPRRDAWFSAVKERCRHFLAALNYAAFAS